MHGKRVTAEEVEALLAAEIRQLAERMAAAMNEAKDGSIIADSELPVFEAHGAFRQQAFEKLLSLVQEKHEAFSPSARRDAQSGSAQGDPHDD